MKKTIVAAATALVALACAGAAAAGTTGSGWSEWEPTRATPFSYGAGDVCPFPVGVAFPTDRELKRSHTDAAGNIDLQEVTGPLVARVTKTATGASVVRNLSGKGTFSYGVDGSLTVDVDGHMLSGFHAGDAPAHELLVFSGHTVLTFAADGSRAVAQQEGTAEDLCRTLA